jgi:hypothetical protein
MAAHLPPAALHAAGPEVSSAESALGGRLGSAESALVPIVPSLPSDAKFAPPEVHAASVLHCAAMTALATRHDPTVDLLISPMSAQ